MGFIKVPIVDSAKNDDRTNLPANSYAYVPLLNTGLANFTKYTQKTYDSLHMLLRESVFNSDTVANGKGLVIGKNEKGGYNFVLRQQYKIVSAAVPTTTDTSGNCKLKDHIYRNCAVVHGPLRSTSEFNGPKDHVEFVDSSSSLPISSTSASGYSHSSC